MIYGKKYTIDSEWVPLDWFLPGVTKRRILQSEDTEIDFLYNKNNKKYIHEMEKEFKNLKHLHGSYEKGNINFLRIYYYYFNSIFRSVERGIIDATNCC